MSVINKMLRDLDARRAEGAAPGHPRQAGLAGTLGTISVPSSAQRPAARLGRWTLPLLLLLVASIAAAWYLGLGTTSPPPAAPLVTVIEAPAMAPAPSASAPESAASAPTETPEVVAEVRPAAEAEPTVLRKKTRRAESASSEVPAAEKKDKSERKRVAPARADTSASVPGQPAAAAAAPPAAASVPVANTVPQRRQAAAQETLAQAQALWNAGSREAALEVLREAVVAVEHAQPADAALLAQLVREQVRMELALGRPAAVLVLLSRLEPVLSGQADLWAVRGNAAQRLARHQESVQAYLAALRLRPGEPRWMLGAAVSLAALGQMEAAAQQAEQARALGPVSPEVLTYLRQAGVPLR
ncbi:MAG: hypothetical protein O9312_01685 [Hylemonella sp.]|nr:hypothetical protein [Hylemonella sp.]